MCVLSLAAGVYGGRWLRLRDLASANSVSPGTSSSITTDYASPPNRETPKSSLPNNSVRTSDGPHATPHSEPSPTAPTSASPSLSPAEQQAAEDKFGPLFRAGYQAFEQQRFGDALESFEQAVRVAPHVDAGHYFLAKTLEQFQWNQRAEAEYRRTLELLPEFTEARQRLSVLLYERGAYQEAIQLLQESLAKNPRDSFTLGELAINYLALDDTEKALEYLTQFEAIAPRDAWLCTQLGLVQEKRGDLAEAETRYREAIAKNAYYDLAHHRLGLLLARQGNTAASQASFAKYDELRQLRNREHSLEHTLLRNANDVEALLELAKTRYALGQKPEAKQTLQRAAQLAPNHPEIRRLLSAWR
jgi:tetratricopeptide (TPR) repeat protein